MTHIIREGIINKLLTFLWFNSSVEELLYCVFSDITATSCQVSVQLNQSYYSALRTGLGI